MKKTIGLSVLGLFAIGAIYFGNIVKAQEMNMSKSYGYNFDIGFYPKDNSGIIYKMESRFIQTITKEKLFSAKSVREIFPVKSTLGIERFQKVSVGVLRDGKNEVVKGEDELLNQRQLDLLKSTNYSDNIFVKAFYEVKNQYSGITEEKEHVYYLSIVPEKEAIYLDGYGNFIAYIKSRSIEKSLKIDPKKLEPGKIVFTVNTNGKIDKVRLENTSGYKELDENLLALISDLPGRWQAASNSQGAKVNQEFVFFFGLEGC